MSSEAPSPDSDPEIAAAIARVARRRAILEQLTEMGVALAADITERSIGSPYHPEMKHDAGKSYAAVARSVRLTLAAETRMDDRIIALCKGGIAEPISRPRRTSGAAPAAEPTGDCRRERPGDPARETVERETPDPDEWTRMPDRPRERLIEGDVRHPLPDGDFRAGVETVRADLGLRADLGRRPDEAPVVSDVDAAQADRPHPDWITGGGSPAPAPALASPGERPDSPPRWRPATPATGWSGSKAPDT